MNKITLLLFLITTFCLAQTDQNLLLHYKFDGSTLDETANNFDGFENNITYVADRFGNENSAVYFNGVDSFIDLPNLTELKPQLPVTFSFWIKYEGTTYKDKAVFNTSFEEDISSGIFFNASAVSDRYSVSFGDGSPHYSPDSRRSYSSNAPVIMNEWHNITIVVVDSMNMNIYIDCKENGGIYSGEGGSLFYSATAGSLGRHDREMAAPADYFKGGLDDFKYWDRALSFDEIQYNCHNLGVSESKRQIFSIYPNPAQNILHFRGAIENDTKIQIFNALGQKIISCPFQEEMDISSLSDGIYFIKIFDKSASTTEKLIVKR